MESGIWKFGIFQKLKIFLNDVKRYLTILNGF